MSIIAQQAGVAAGTQALVAVMTVGALAAAIISARITRRRPATEVDTIEPELLDADLLGRDQDPLPVGESQVVGWYERVFLLVLLGYALFDRAFAWIHVPGTPLFVGEATLALGILAMFSSRAPLRGSFRNSAAIKILAIWMGWGAALLALQVTTYGLDAIRDSALWYYGAIALTTVFLVTSDPTRFGRWADLFTRFIPMILIWFPIAMVLDILFGGGPIFVPDSTVSIFNHRFGNIGVLTAAIVAYLWLVDRERGTFAPSQRATLSALATVVILFVGFQNRGGLLSAVLGLALMIVFMRSQRSEVVLAVGGVAVGLAAIAIFTGLTVPLSGGREISAAQMIDNIGSIIDPDSGGERQQSTTRWRLELWTAVLDDIVTEHPVAGFGPGPDLGERYGVSGREDQEGLRNPHNSHLSVMARMGMVGFGLWAALWIAWTTQLLILRARLLARNRPTEAGLAAWLIVFAVMILLNAIFDPTLEGPQVGFWLWTVLGLGAGLQIVYSGVVPASWRERITSGDTASADGSVVVEADLYPLEPR